MWPGQRIQAAGEKIQINQIGGKSLEEWIKEITSKDPSKGEKAIRTILLFGPDRAVDAVPILISQLKKHPKVVILDSRFRVHGIIALGIILGGAEKPDPKLIGDTVTVLTRFLVTDTQAIVQFRAAQGLGRIGPEAKPAIPKLIAAANDLSTWETREAAVTALGFIARDPKIAPTDEVLNALIKRLGDPASPIRLAAVKSLLWVGGSADPKKKAMLVKGLKFHTLNDPDPRVRIWGCLAIMLLEGKAFPLPKLLP